MSRFRSRVGTAARWLAPSAACAAAGALTGGIVEALGTEYAGAAAASLGFLVLAVLPVLFVGSVLVRAVYAAWRPDELVAAVREDDGAAPVFAGWVAVVWVGALALGWATFQGTWLLAKQTAFKPLVVGFVAPVLVVAAALGIVALSRPAARLFTSSARAVDARWKRSGRRTLLTPRRILAGAALLGLATLYAIWRLMVRKKLGPLDTSVLHVPALAVVATALAHVAWSRIRRARVVAAGAAAVVAAAAIAFALAAVYTRPAVTLGIWGDQPIAGFAIDTLFDLDAIRSRIPLTELRPVERPGAAHPDIVLITIDTLRADRTPPYGGKADMPVLRDLGERGTVFLWAFSPSNVTRRSVPSLVTGLDPHRVRGRVIYWNLRLDPRHIMLAERLRAGGYETAGFTSWKGLWDPKARTGLQRGLEYTLTEQNGVTMAKLARTWLEERERRPDKRPLFLWVHIFEPHNWAGGSESHGEDERYRMYDRSLAAADRIVRDIMAAFSTRPPDEAPITIVTSDHGEALGEHGEPFHSTNLYNSQIRVPLVFTGPGIKAQRVTESASVTDLTPTILELAGFSLAPGTQMDGRSLAPLITGARAEDMDLGTAFAAMIKDRSNPGGSTALVRGTWKLIQDGISYKLYDLRTDPYERVDLRVQKRQIFEDLRRQLTERRRPRSPF